MKLAVILFVLMYVLIIFLPKYRMFAALGTAALFVILGILPVQAVPGAVNWNALMMMCGTMIIVYFFIDSGMPAKIADLLLEKSGNVRTVTIYMSLFAGLISAFIDNVATVLMIAPVAIAISKKLKISPVPMVISIAVSSNLQGAATLVGDTTSILLASYANMTFTDFFFMNGKPGIFFAVELGALATIPIMLFLFRDMKEPVEAGERTEITSPVPGIMLVLTIVVLIVASFFPNRPELTNGIICTCFGLICAVHSLVSTHKTESVVSCLKDVDYMTLILLASLFVVVAGVSNVGIIDDIASLIVKIGGTNRFLLYTIVVWVSVAVSAFVDNIPYVTAMLPVLSGVGTLTGTDPTLLYFGLLTGATLGGNITPVGASANITGIGILKKNGYDVPNKAFMRISVPFTLTAVMTGYLFLWFVWG
jgi:Na+/H+ antiporter NhaD/arsenite permease-like protein